MPKDVSRASRDVSKHVHQNKKVDFTFNIRDLPWTSKQQQFIQLVQDKNTKCVMVKGPAGTAKSCLAVYTLLHLLLNKKISDIIYIRPAVESASKSLGHLPGDLSDKIGPYTVPFYDKLEELLEQGVITRLIAENRLQTYAINYLRGCHFAVKGIIVDEAQSATFHDLVTVITRMGEFSKMLIVGDPNQSDLHNGNSHDFDKLCQMFDDEQSREQGIHTFEFTSDDIVRSEFVKFVVKKLEASGYQPNL